MLFKVALSNGQVRIVEWKENLPLGQRVLIRTSTGLGTAGIIVGRKDEGEVNAQIVSVPDKFPLILPHHLEIAKDLGNYYSEIYGKILWDFIPSAFDWYEEEFVKISNKNFKNLPKNVLEILNYVKERREIPYENLKKKFRTDILNFLIGHNFIRKYEKWVIPKVEEEVFSLNLPLEEALSRVRSEEKKKLILYIYERIYASRQELKEEGFKFSHINDLVRRGILKKEFD